MPPATQFTGRNVIIDRKTVGDQAIHIEPPLGIAPVEAKIAAKHALCLDFDHNLARTRRRIIKGLQFNAVATEKNNALHAFSLLGPNAPACSKRSALVDSAAGPAFVRSSAIDMLFWPQQRPKHYALRIGTRHIGDGCP
jgi:hypothetical protein